MIHIYIHENDYLVYKWDEDKNSILKAQRGFSFNDVLKQIKEHGIIDNYKYPKEEKYPNQFIYIVELGQTPITTP